MKRFLAGIFVLGVLNAAGFADATPADDRIPTLNTQIEKNLGRGNYSLVQKLRLELAERLNAVGHFEEAAREYELLLAARPSRRVRVRLYILLAKARQSVGDYASAIAAYENALHDDNKNFEAGVGLARAYSKMELYASGAEHYQRCLKQRPDRGDLYADLAFCWQKLGYLGRAVEDYTRALKTHPTSDAYLGLADSYVRLDQLPKAEEVLKAAKNFSSSAEFDVHLGEIYRRQGKRKEACAVWEEALKSDPSRDDVRVNLALTYSAMNRLEDSERLFRHLVATYPQSPLVHFSQAWALFDRRNYRAAEGEAQIALSLGPTEVVRHYTEKLLDTLQKQR